MKRALGRASEDRSDVSSASSASHCAGCPPLRHRLLPQLIGLGQCQLQSVTVEARQLIPEAWSTRYSFGLVRRGLVLRQRVDGQGRTTVIDAVGPGQVFHLAEPEPPGGRAATGLAVTRALICVAGNAPVRRALLAGGADACDMFRLSQDVSYRMDRLSDARGRPGAAARVAALLCALADTLVREPSQPGFVPAGFLQRDLAAMLSIRPESYCRVIRQLRAQQLIRQDVTGTLLLDRAALEAL